MSQPQDDFDFDAQPGLDRKLVEELAKVSAASHSDDGATRLTECIEQRQGTGCRTGGLGGTHRLLELLQGRAEDSGSFWVLSGSARRAMTAQAQPVRDYSRV